MIPPPILRGSPSHSSGSPGPGHERKDPQSIPRTLDSISVLYSTAPGRVVTLGSPIRHPHRVRNTDSIPQDSGRDYRVPHSFPGTGRDHQCNPGGCQPSTNRVREKLGFRGRGTRQDTHRSKGQLFEEQPTLVSVIDRMSSLRGWGRPSRSRGGDVSLERRSQVGHGHTTR